MIIVHMTDAQFRKQALHFHYRGFKENQLTNDIKEVTCKTCLRMWKRHGSATR